ncbi:MAG: OmpH family outer membrane protein [Candidatus Latescibacteria bacterium]|nr:OmpH family outer membrane protein [Candidatus Latescibacterota bacterium]
MKRTVLLGLGVLMVSALALSAPAFAQMKMGYVDTDQILAEYKPFQDAQSEYRRYEDELQKQYAEKENVVGKLREDYERQKLLLSDAKKQEMEKDIQTKLAELQKFYQDSSGKVQQKNQELSEPIFKEVNVVLERVAKTGGYDFVFNANQVSYAKDEHNITQKVLEELNKELEAKKKGSPATKAGAPR